MLVIDESTTQKWDSYKSVQQDNTSRFNRLTRSQRKKLRDWGYNNVGRKNVEYSYHLLDWFSLEKPAREYLEHGSTNHTLLDKVIKKSGLPAAIVCQSLNLCPRTQYRAGQKPQSKRSIRLIRFENCSRSR